MKIFIEVCIFIVALVSNCALIYLFMHNINDFNSAMMCIIFMVIFDIIFLISAYSVWTDIK